MVVVVAQNAVMLLLSSLVVSDSLRVDLLGFVAVAPGSTLRVIFAFFCSLRSLTLVLLGGSLLQENRCLWRLFCGSLKEPPKREIAVLLLLLLLPKMKNVLVASSKETNLFMFWNSSAEHRVNDPKRKCE